MSIRDKIRQKIASEGPVSFSEFMATALYDREEGYYSSGRVRFGQAGDFVTSPHVSGLFGACMANLAARADEALGRPSVFTLAEGGPGEGKLAADILDALRDSHPNVYERTVYVTLDESPALAARQARALAAHRGKVSAARPERAVGLYLSNELADALPVDVYETGPAGLVELRVDCEEERFLWRAATPYGESAELAFETLSALGETRGALGGEGSFRFEVCPGLGNWLESAAGIFERGFIATIDYGDEEAKLYGSDKPEGTLRGFADGRFTDGVLFNPGLADITASVNFSALRRRMAPIPGLCAGRLIKQWELLGELGLAAALERMEGGLSDEVEMFALRQEVMPLLFPGVGMGESFKALAMGKGVSPELLWR